MCTDVDNKSFREKITIVTIACSTTKINILMGKNQRILMLCIAICCLSLHSFAQNLTAVSGNVKNSGTKESIAAVSVMVKGSSAGAYTDDRGNFKFTTTQKPPFTLVVSS